MKTGPTVAISAILVISNRYSAIRACAYFAVSESQRSCFLEYKVTRRKINRRIFLKKHLANTIRTTVTGKNHHWVEN